MKLENRLKKISDYVEELMRVIDLIEEKGTRQDLMYSLFSINKELKKLMRD